MKQRRHFPNRSYSSLQIESLLKTQNCSSMSSAMLTPKSPSNETPVKLFDSPVKIEDQLLIAPSPSSTNGNHFRSKSRPKSEIPKPNYNNNQQIKTGGNIYRPTKELLKRIHKVEFTPKYKNENETPFERKREFLEGHLGFLNHNNGFKQEKVELDENNYLSNNNNKIRNSLGIYNRIKSQRNNKIAEQCNSITNPELDVNTQRFRRSSSYFNYSKKKKLDEIYSTISIFPKDNPKQVNVEEARKILTQKEEKKKNDLHNFYSKKDQEHYNNYSKEIITKYGRNEPKTRKYMNLVSSLDNYVLNSNENVKDYKFTIRTKDQQKEDIEKVFASNGIHAYNIKQGEMFDKENKNNFEVNIRDNNNLSILKKLRYKLRNRGILLDKA